MCLPRLQKGFAHIFILLALVIIGIVAFEIFYFSRNQSLPFFTKSPVVPTSWSNLKTQSSGKSAIYLGESGNPRLIAGNFSGYEDKKDAESISWAFLEKNKDLYQIKNPKEELKIEQKNKTDNFTIVKFAQYYQNIPVYGGGISVRITPDLKIDSVSSTFVPNIDLSIKPKIDQKLAINKLGENADSKVQLVVFSPTVYNRKGNPKLAWSIEGRDGNYVVDAQNGEVLDGYATTIEALNREVYDDNEASTNPGTLWINEKGIASGLANGQPDQEAKNIYSNLDTTYNYYSARLNRDSWDGNGAKIINSVHYREDPKNNYNNASWNDKEQRIRFGTGWGNTLDIAAHEFTHGVTASTAKLQYQGQSGALNESFSDIFASFAKIYNGTGDWIISVGKNNVLRNMKNPFQFNQPNSVNGTFYIFPSPPCFKNNDWCGVHTNSSIPNKVAQLLVDGGIVGGYVIFPLGVEKTEQLFYYILTERLGQTSQFIDFRNEMVEAVKSGFKVGNTKYEFTDLEKASVNNALAAVGLGSFDINYDGEQDKDKDPEKGIVILDVKGSEEKIFMANCSDPKEVLVYALAKDYGGEKIKSSKIIYHYENSKDIKNGETLDNGPWDDAGELKEGPWYKFRLKNLSSGGKIYYQLEFQGDSNSVSTKEYPVTVETCGNNLSLQTKVILPDISIKQSFIITPSPTIAIIRQNQITVRPTSSSRPTSTPTTPLLTPSPNPKKTLNIRSDSTIDGFISSNGRIGDEVIAGEYSPGARAFLSFDLSAIPSGSEITSATLSTDGAIASADPFSLGNLTLIDYQYDTLDSGDYRADGSTIGRMTSLSTNSFDVMSNVRSKMSSNKKLQIRIQFDNDTSDNRTTDYLTFPSDRMNLAIEYF